MSVPPRSASEIATPLRIVFLGTPALAADILECLVTVRDLLRVVAVVTRPDEARGRGMAMTPSEVAAVAARHQVPTLKPTRIKTDSAAGDSRRSAPHASQRARIAAPEASRRISRRRRNSGRRYGDGCHDYASG